MFNNTPKFKPIYLILILCLSSDCCFAEAFGPSKSGMAVSYSTDYNSADDIGFVMVHGLYLLDYDQIWFHDAPQTLKFKIEPALGVTTHGPDDDLLASLNAFAHYYFQEWTGGPFRPYFEAGIGLIFTDFKLQSQGSRLNFNPQLGLGTDLVILENLELYTSIRIHHISNAGMLKDNRGVNALMFIVGVYF
jgi:hypothetical protein